MRKLLRVGRLVALCFLILYIILLFPESEQHVLDSTPTQQARPFAWNQDAYWDSLERSYAKALRLGCDAVTPLIHAASSQWRERLDLLNLHLYQPQTNVFREIEQLAFGLGPWIAVCPDRLPEFVDLVARTRDAVKQQSIRWDLNGRVGRETLYRLLYGGRMAVEEVTLQVPADKQPPALVRGAQEPSQTPHASLLGVEIHSGDILVSRGGAPTSALIARGNDFPGNFSHIALVYVDSKTHLAKFIESHIERGVAVSSPEEYLNDKKLRVMVLRLRADLPVMLQDPMLPHKAATIALERALARHIPYDFSMDYRSSDKLFCSEVASAAYREVGVTLWMGLSHLTAPGLRQWLADFGVEHFETQEPSDLEYDSQLRVVAEWRDSETLRKDHIDNAVTEAMLEGAEHGDRLVAHWYLLPYARIAKGYSVVLNWFGTVGPVPEGMSALSALKHDSYATRHAAIKSGMTKGVEQFQQQHGFAPPYWELLRLARIAAGHSGQPDINQIKH
jgi:hypothetical protein